MVVRMHKVLAIPRSWYVVRMLQCIIWFVASRYVKRVPFVDRRYTKGFPGVTVCHENNTPSSCLFLWYCGVVTKNGLECTCPVKPELSSILMTSSHLFLSRISPVSSQYTRYPSFVAELRSTMTTRRSLLFRNIRTSNSTAPEGNLQFAQINYLAHGSFFIMEGVLSE